MNLDRSTSGLHPFNARTRFAGGFEILDITGSVGEDFIARPWTKTCVGILILTLRDG